MSAHGQALASHAGAPARTFVWVWIWLVGITGVEVFLGYKNIAPVIMLTILIGLSVMKAALIMAYFMHLKFEKLNLVMLTLSPLLISAILFFMTRGETRMQDPTHEVITHLGEELHVEAAHEK